MRKLQPVKKLQMTLLVVLLAVAVMAMIMLPKCSHRQATKPSIHPGDVKSGGDTIDVAIEISPLSYRLNGDTVTGLDYALIKEVMRIGNRPVKFHPFAPLKYAIQGLENGIFDLVVSSLPSTSELKSKYMLTDPVYLDREVLVQLYDNEHIVKAPEDLGGDTVWIAAGSPFASRIRNLSAEIGDTIHIVEATGRTAEHLVMLVARGEIPRAVVNEGLARQMKTTAYPNIDIETHISFTQFQTWLLTSNNRVLRDSINTWLDSLRRTPVYDCIVNPQP